MDHSKARQYYDEHPEQFAAAPALSHILADNRALAEDLLRQLADGADFAALARTHSLCPSGREGGGLGRVPCFLYVPEFGSALGALTAVGQVIGPVQSRFGWHLIRMDGERQSVPFADCADMLAQSLARRDASAGEGGEAQ